MPARTDGPLLLRLPNWLGDLLLAWPILEAAAAAPRTVMVLGPDSFGPLVTPRFPGVPYLPWSRSRRYALIGTLRRARPAAALLLTDSLSSALLAALAGIPERVGYAAGGRGPLLTRRVPRAGPARTLSRRAEYGVLAAAAGLRVEPGPPRLDPLPAEREAARSVRARHGAAGTRYAVVAPGASYGPAKRWPAARFAEVVGTLERGRGWRTLLVGGPQDRAATAAVRSAAGAGALDLGGSTDLPSLVGLLAEAEVVVSNDSGVMHLAAALGRPTMAVFGSTSPLWTSSDAPWVRNLYAAYPCSPCFRRTCPIGYACLEAVTPASATRALADLGGSWRGSGAPAARAR